MGKKINGKKLTTLAKEMKKARKDWGMTQGEFAKAVKLKKCNINAYEQGRSMPKLDNLIKIAKFLEKDVNELV